MRGAPVSDTIGQEQLAFFVASVNPACTSNPHTGVAMQEFTTLEKCEAAKKEITERTKRDALCVAK